MLLNAKIQIPRLKSETELVEKKIPADFLSGKYPVSIFCYPFGSGKTTFVTNYVRKYKKKVLWYHLDAMDNQELVFLEYIRYLFSQISSKKDHNTMTELEPPYAYLAEMLRLIGTLEDDLEPPRSAEYCLVLDCFETITNETILAMVQQLIEYRPKVLSIILITNQEIPNFLFRYEMKKQCLVLAKDELYWTPDETLSWIKKMLPDSTKTQSSLIYQQAEGWPMGIIFLTEYVKNQKDWNHIFDWDEIFLNTYFGDYLAEQIRQKKPDEDLWNFILLSAIPLNFTNESGMAVLDDPAFIGHLQTVYRENWFLRYEKGVYHYLPFFRQYLNQICDVERKKEILQRLFSFYIKKKKYQLAARYGVEGQLVEQLVKLLHQYGDKLLQAEAFSVLEQIINLLELREVELDLKLLEIIAQVAYGSGQYEKMEKYLNQGDISFGKENRFSAYRSLYKAVRQLEEDPERYGSQINNALFFLKENKIELPYFTDQDKKTLMQLQTQYEEIKNKNGARIRIKCLGSFEVMVMENQRMLSWRTKKGRELFAYLVEQQGKPVERKQLIQMLWSEEIPDNAVAMLHNMIYNIRKDLSTYQLEGLVRYQEKKYSICMESIYKAGPELELLSQLVEKKNITQLLEKEQNFAKYWGRYLEDIDNHWAEELANYYDKIYLAGCRLLATAFFEENQYQQAAVYYKNALLMDCYSEEIAEKLITCYHMLGEWKQLKKQYQEFRKRHETDLGVLPSQKFETFYHSCSLS